MIIDGVEPASTGTVYGSAAVAPFTARDAAAVAALLAARRLRRPRRPELHVVGWGTIDTSVADSFRAEIDTAPVLLLDPVGCTSVRGMLDAAIADCRGHGAADRRPALARYRMVTQLLDGDTAVQDVLPPPKTWAQQAFPPFATVAGVATAVMQGTGSDHPLLWTVGLAMFAVAITVGVVHGIIRPLRLRTWMRQIFGAHVNVAEWFTEQKHGQDPQPDVNAVLARAFLLDLAGEWGWATLLSYRRMRIDHPVLLLPDHTPHRGPDLVGVLLDQYAQLSAPPVLLITDRPGGEQLSLATAGRLPDGPWRAARSPAPRPGRASRCMRTVYRRLIVAPSVRFGVATVVLAGAGGYVFAATHPPRCADAPASALTTTDHGERIGVQYCGDPFVDPADTAEREGYDFPERRIYDENLEVQRHYGPLAVTVVLITALTQDPHAGAPRSILAEREGLAGAYAAQMSINKAPGNHPMIQLAIANAGYHARHIDEVVDMVQQLLRTGPRVVASVVTVDSTDPVQRSLRRLSADSLVMASPTMTADGFSAQVPGFLQLTSSNADQVALVSDYLRRTAPNAVIDVVSPTQTAGDRYTATLADAARHHDMNVVPWDPGRMSPGFQRMCRGGATAPVVYYAGRYGQFADFVSDLGLVCGGRHPLLVADDSVSRFLADDSLTGHLPHGTDVVVTVRGNLLSCRALGARATAADRADGAAGRRADFLADIHEYLGRCPGSKDRVADIAGGWAVVVYDIVRMFDDATRRVMLASPALLTLGHDTSRQLLRHLLLIDDPAEGHTYAGAVEPLHWGRDGAAHLSLSLYCIQELRTPFARTDPAMAPVAQRHDGFDTIASGQDECAAGH